MTIELVAWVAVSLLLVLWVQAQVRQHLFLLSYRTTRNPGCALRLFSLLMLPGTVVHESSHVVAATLVGTRVSHVSFKPRYDNGGIELGSMVAKEVGPLRSSIISVAPVLIGSAIILLIAWFVFDFPGAVEHIERGSWEAAAQTLLYSLGGIGAWIGAYVVLMVSVNMLPSAQDLKAGGWLFVGTVILLLILWILILTKGSPLGNAVAITHGVLIWLGLALTFILILTVPVFILLRLLTLG